MVTHLRRLGQRHAALSGRLIDAEEGMPSAAAYRARFGSLLEAYRLAGLQPARDYGHVEINRTLRGLYPGMAADLAGRLAAAGATVARDEGTGLLLINGEFSAALVLSRCRRTAGPPSEPTPFPNCPLPPLPPPARWR